MRSSDENHPMMNIGQGSDIFDLKISIEKFHNPSQITSDNNPCWLSYRFFGQVLQSGVIRSSCESFSPMANSFRIRSSLPELAQHFAEKKNSSLRVHVCTNGQVLGTAVVDLSSLFGAQEKNNLNFEGRMMKGEYDVRPSAEHLSVDKTNSQLTMTLCLDREPRQSKELSTVRLSISSQTDNDIYASPTTETSDKSQNDCGKSALYTRQKQLEEKENELKTKEAQLNKKEKEVYETTVALEKKRCEWEQWRHQEEFKWHEKLRHKEAATMRTIEERVSSIEKERLRSLETSRSEYEKLESRLRNALIEVESKERQLKEVEVTHQNERNRKMAELDLREKLMTDELRHTIEIEVSHLLFASKYCQ